MVLIEMNRTDKKIITQDSFIYYFFVDDIYSHIKDNVY